MKKGFLISLLLVCAFLIGNTGKALADFCSVYQEYECTYIDMQYGYVYGTGPDCIELCYDNGFEVNAYSLMYDWFSGYLYPTPGSKNLLGTADIVDEGWAGCSVEKRGRSMIMRFTYIQYGGGYVTIERCKACNDCCQITPSDRRLKKFIREVKGIYNQIGLKMYIWQWTEKAERTFGLKGYSAGVIAQEVKEKYPDAVVEYKGYLNVRYGYLDRLLLMQ
jgi:hypothetical protein